MSSDKRRKIARLRALANSTSFPAEAASARAKADKLEAELGGPEKAQVAWDYAANHQRYGAWADAQRYSDAFTAEELRRLMDELMTEMAMRAGFRK